MHRESEQRAWGKSTLPFPLEVGFDEVEGEVDAYVDAVFWASSTQNKAWHVQPSDGGKVPDDLPDSQPFCVSERRWQDVGDASVVGRKHSIRRQTPASGTTRADSSAGQTSGRVSPASGCLGSLPKVPGGRIFTPYNIAGVRRIDASPEEIALALRNPEKLGSKIRRNKGD